MYQTKVRSKLSCLSDYTEELYPFHATKWIQKSLLPGEEYCFAESFLGTFFLEDLKY